ncbi:hypothetical protein FRB94_012195 [Tulasnella sp. JGI-2019a]|nr:hypothetical protein FRB93_010337 [Tulasnella sp. JGI-2019a]KAG8991880.1 hypothetical protein FRB94_012195 [Tulasnella sp. JGI-2019a]
MPGIKPEQSTFKRFVEVGRVCLIENGRCAGKIAPIVEIIDHNRAILDSPATGVPRGPYAYRHLTLTSHVMKLPRGSRTGTVRKKMAEQKVLEKWEGSSWYKRRTALAARKTLSDFGRFEVMILKKRRRDVTRKAIHKEKKAA